MRGSKEKNLMLNTSTSNSNCFTSILKSFTCGSNLPSPTPSDHHILPKFKSNGYIHPNPNELPKTEPTSTNPHFLDHDGGFEVGFAKDHHPRQPGLVARLMGLESMPHGTRDSIMNLRSKSLNSLHLYIFPDTFLDHVSPSPSFVQHQRRMPCHRRALTTSPILCVEQPPLEEKLEPCTSNVEGDVASKPEKRRRRNERSTSKKIDEKGLVVGRRKEIDECRIGRKKGFENKVVVASKCRVNQEQSTRKRPIQRGEPRNEIKYGEFGAKLKKEKGVCRVRNVDEFKSNRNHSHSKEGSTRSRRRRSSTKIMMDQQHDNTKQGLFQHHMIHIQERNSRGFQGKEKFSRAREEKEDRKELMDQVIRLTEEYVRDGEWINFDENVKELGVDFAREMLEVLISQLLAELLR